ncbi:MAG: hypothetical protein RL516_1078 [Bacteroidota bacterium]|jgi:hypothetical protein
MEAKKTLINKLVIVIFSVMILLPFINSNLDLVAEIPANENREKAARPEYKKNELEKFFKDYDAYYADNFGFRNSLIRFLDRFEYFNLKSSAVPSEVIIGNNDWFYETKSVANYKGANLFTAEELQKIKTDLEKRTKWAALRGMKYYVAIVPNKMNVYPEFLPYQVVKVSQKTRYDQLMSLNNPPYINIVDVRSNILTHKKDGVELYQRTDDHWNDLGAYYGYEAIANYIKKDYSDLYIANINDFTREYESRLGSQAKILNVEDKFPEKFLALKRKGDSGAYDGPLRNYKRPAQIAEWDFQVVRINDRQPKRKCFFIRDSFTMLMMKYFEESFHECVFIHDEWKYRMHEDLLVKEKPDLSVNIILETEIHRLLSNQFEGDITLPIEKYISLKADNGKYVCAEQNKELVATKDNAQGWETFNLIWRSKNTVNLMAYTNQFLSAEIDGSKQIMANREAPSDWETFTIIQLDANTILLKAFNNKFVKLQGDKLFATADTKEQATRFTITYAN